MIDLQFKFDSLQDAIESRTNIVRTLLGKFDPEDNETIHFPDKDMAITAITNGEYNEFQFLILLDRSTHPKGLPGIMVSSKNADVKLGGDK